jgi:hypothetical protein
MSEFQESVGVIEVEDAPFFLCGDFLNFVFVGPNYGAGAGVWRGVEEFVVNGSREDHWMTAAALIDGKYDRSSGLQKGRDEAVDKSGADKRMVHGAE